MSSQPPTPQAVPKSRTSSGRAGVQPAVDVELLVNGRAIVVVRPGGPAGSRLHGRQDLAAQAAAADGVERQRRAESPPRRR